MKPTILFADNESGIRQFCRQELEADGFRVVLAEDGEDAVNVLHTYSVDLAILDEYMPRCGGRESAGRMKQSHAQLPVILFTSDTFLESYRSPLVDETIIKSEDLTALRAAIARLLPPVVAKKMCEFAAIETSRSNAVTLNAAFFREIKEQNVTLRELLTSLKAWIDRGLAGYYQRSRLIELLSALHREVALHFALEEGYGYFDDAVSVAPEIASRANTLRVEHSALYSDIDRLVKQSEATRINITGFSNLLWRCRAFLDQLQVHERRERELIQEVYNNDLGVGD